MMGCGKFVVKESHRGISGGSVPSVGGAGNLCAAFVIMNHVDKLNNAPYSSYAISSFICHHTPFSALILFCFLDNLERGETRRTRANYANALVRLLDLLVVA